MAISFHRELTRAKAGNEKSLYARHQPVKFSNHYVFLNYFFNL